MIKCRKLTGNIEIEEPSHYLSAEMNKDQKDLILNLSDKDFGRSELMKDAGRTCATTKLSKRKLYNMGCIKAYSGLKNDPVRIGRMKRAAMLAESMSHVSRVEKKMLQKKRNLTLVNYLKCQRVLESSSFRKKKTLKN